MYMTPLRENLLVALFTAGLGLVGWLLVNQYQTNKSLWKALTNAIIEFKDAIQLITERDTQQKSICQMHREQSAEKMRALTAAIDKLEDDIKDINGYKYQEPRSRSRFNLSKKDE